MPSLRIIAVQSGTEAQAIRAAAECWGYEVAVTWVGNSQQIVDDFNRSDRTDVLILAGHGDEGGLILPPLDPSIASDYPYEERISARQFAEFVRPISDVVVASACMLGLEKYAQVFLNAGVRYYIGPTDYPDGGAAVMYSLGLLYELRYNGFKPLLAHKAACSVADDRCMYKIYGA